MNSSRDSRGGHLFFSNPAYAKEIEKPRIFSKYSRRFPFDCLFPLKRRFASVI